MSHRKIISAFLVGLALTACAARETPVTDVKGSCGDAFKSQVCTWAKTKGDSLTEVGAIVPIASIENAPADAMDMAWPPTAVATLDIPQSVQKSSGFTHLTMYWESMGHPPGPYLTPHFDFHFYTSTPAERAAMDCKDRTKPAALAAGYMMVDVPLPPDMAKMIKTDTLIGLCVPQMGQHSLLTSEMQSKDVFRGSMVIGYYGSKPIFIEPMLTKTMLLEKKSFDLPIPTIPGMTGPHPTKFHAEYDAAKAEYRFTFSGFAV